MIKQLQLNSPVVAHELNTNAFPLFRRLCNLINYLITNDGLKFEDFIVIMENN